MGYDMTKEQMVICHYCKKEIPMHKAWAKERKAGQNLLVYYCIEHYEKERRNWEKVK